MAPQGNDNWASTDVEERFLKNNNRTLTNVDECSIKLNPNCRLNKVEMILCTLLKNAMVIESRWPERISSDQLYTTMGKRN
jgi:hypothetical protein